VIAVFDSGFRHDGREYSPADGPVCRRISPSAAHLELGQLSQRRSHRSEASELQGACRNIGTTFRRNGGAKKIARRLLNSVNAQSSLSGSRLAWPISVLVNYRSSNARSLCLFKKHEMIVGQYGGYWTEWIPPLSKSSIHSDVFVFAHSWVVSLETGESTHCKGSRPSDRNRWKGGDRQERRLRQGPELRSIRDAHEHRKRGGEESIEGCIVTSFISPMTVCRC
jgi:hypothetical protein